MNPNLESLSKKIVNDCKYLINKKNVNIDELAFSLSMSTSYLEKTLREQNEDFLLYLEMYDTLVGW